MDDEFVLRLPVTDGEGVAAALAAFLAELAPRNCGR